MHISEVLQHNIWCTASRPTQSRGITMLHLTVTPLLICRQHLTKAWCARQNSCSFDFSQHESWIWLKSNNKRQQDPNKKPWTIMLSCTQKWQQLSSLRCWVGQRRQLVNEVLFLSTERSIDTRTKLWAADTCHDIHGGGRRGVLTYMVGGVDIRNDDQHYWGDGADYDSVQS